MVSVPIEVATARDALAREVSTAVSLANACQSEFIFSMAEADLQLRMRMLAYGYAQADRILDQIEAMRSRARGYHPFIIAVIDSDLDGKLYGNLFGSHRARTGIAVITTAQVPDIIIPRDRMTAYYIYYLARYALSFIAPDQKNHEGARSCVFDRKYRKTAILSSMRAGALCDECRRSLVEDQGMLSPGQFDALDHLFALSESALAGDLEVNQPRVFVGSSSEGLQIATKLQELLSDDYSITIWNQGTVFGLGEATLEALERAVLEYDNGIFVFTPDDELNTRGERKRVARDNVIFELGMFVGKLGRAKAFVLQPGRHAIALPTDLNGITTAIYDPDESDITSALELPASQLRSAIRPLTA